MENNRSFRDYQIGVICALDHERTAVEAMLDERHRRPAMNFDSAENDYTYGHIGSHNIVITSLPQHMYGNVPAAEVATTFKGPALRFLVGIAAGIPRPSSTGHDVRLGDVVVSTTQNGANAVINYAEGRLEQGEDEQSMDKVKVTSQTIPPPKRLLKVVSGLQSRYREDGPGYLRQLAWMLEKREHYNDPAAPDQYYGFPKRPDILFKSNIRHVKPTNDADVEPCGLCPRTPDTLVQRNARKQGKALRQDIMSHDWTHVRDDGTYEYPMIHYGVIGSASMLVKSGPARDRMFHNIKKQTDAELLCVEMEANGTLYAWDGCLIIRGICDYADAHKNDDWQRFAAAMAAAYFRDLILYMAVANHSDNQAFRESLLYQQPNEMPAARTNLTNHLSSALARLRDVSGLLKPAIRYQMCMTVQGLAHYNVIWTLIAQSRPTLHFAEAYQALHPLLPSQASLGAIWRRFAQEKESLRQGPFLAVLYMIHLELLHPRILAETGLGFVARGPLLDRFRAMSHWEPCPNECGLEWNFVASDYGFGRTQHGASLDTIECLLLRLNKDHAAAIKAGVALFEEYDPSRIEHREVEDAKKLRKSCNWLWQLHGLAA